MVGGRKSKSSNDLDSDMEDIFLHHQAYYAERKAKVEEGLFELQQTDKKVIKLSTETKIYTHFWILSTFQTCQKSSKHPEGQVR